MTNDDPLPSTDRAKNIVQGLGSLTVQNLATALLGLVFSIALVRLLSPTQYGVYSGLVVVLGLAGTIATMGLNQSVARYLAFLQRQDESTSWVAARKIIYIALLLTVIVTAVYSLITPELSLYFSKTTRWTGTFLLAGAWLFLTPLSGVCQGIVQGLRKYALLAKMLLISKVVMVTFAIGVLYFYRNIDVAIIAWVALSVIMIGWTLSLTRSKLQSSKGVFKYSTVLKYTYPLGIAATITLVASSADLVVVAGYLNPISLGVYNVAVTISTVLTTLFVAPLMTTLLPELSSSTREDDISNGMRLAFRFLVLGVLPGSFLVAATSKQLIDLFSGGKGVYFAGTPSLELIAFFYIFYGIQLILVVMFQAIGKTMYAMIVGVATAATDIGVSMVLVPRIGLLGAASAKVSVAIVGALIGFYLGRSFLKSLKEPGFYAKSMLSAVIPFSVTFALSYYVSIRLVTLIPYAFVFGAVFLFCLRLFRLLTDEDKVFITHLLPKFLHRFVRYL